jgi:putative aminopeptidase FrvX
LKGDDDNANPAQAATLVAHVDEPVRCAQSSSHYVPQFSSAYSFDSSFVLISVYMNARAWDNRFACSFAGTISQQLRRRQ